MADTQNTLQTSQILKGSKINLFVDNETIGFSTSHNLNITVNTTDIATKDHGDYPAVLAQTVTWELTTDHLYSQAGRKKWMDITMAKEPIEVVFSEVTNYSNTDEHGIVDTGIAAGGAQGTDAWTVGTVIGAQGGTGDYLTPAAIIAKGKALVTNFSITAAQGDTAQMSVSLRGVGSLQTAPSA